MDLRIGIAESPQILELELDDDTDRAALKERIEDALAGKSEVLWVRDRKGKDLGVPSAKLGFVEMGTSDAERRIGFGA